MQRNEPESVSAALVARVHEDIARSGGWLPFDRYMALALYEPRLGYYMRGGRVFGDWAASGSDFVTAPELSPLFGAAFAAQLAQALDATGCDEIWEFGAGSGALAQQLLAALGTRVARYTIVDLSGTLRTRQQQRLAAFADRVRWLDRLPERIDGVVVGNEVLDAMPVKRIAWDGAAWHERGVVRAGAGLAFADRPTTLRPPVEGPWVPGTVTEIAEQAPAFIRTLAASLGRGAAFFIDYGFPEAEFFHPQRTGGTLAAHRLHRVEFDEAALLEAPGTKDLTAHVDFTAIALAGQEAGCHVLGYTSQARFLINCQIAPLLAGAGPVERARAQLLLAEHEMGELFKVVGFASAATPFDAIGFAEGDRSHRL